jgi:hypothetical protein
VWRKEEGRRERGRNDKRRKRRWRRRSRRRRRRKRKIGRKYTVLFIHVHVTKFFIILKRSVFTFL